MNMYKWNPQKTASVLFLILLLPSAFGVVFSQSPGDVEVRIEGLSRTKKSFIEKMIRGNKVSPVDSLTLEQDILRLQQLPSVAHAAYTMTEEVPGKRVITYTIVENHTLIPFANIYSSTNDDFATRLGLQEFNLLGENITVGGYYQYDIYNSYGVLFNAPYLFSREWGLSASHYNLTTQEPVFLDAGVAQYRYNNVGVELLMVHSPSVYHRFQLGGGFFTEDYQYTFGTTEIGVPQALKVNKHLIKLLYKYEKVAYNYQYLHGFKSLLNLQYVGSPDANLPDFPIGFNDFILYRTVGNKSVWASRLRLGLSKNEKTPFAPFTLDNNINIRGVGNTIDRGTGTMVLNTEWRYTLFEKDWLVLQSNVFVDMGSWRLPGGKLSDFTDPDNIYIFPGVGLRIKHKHIHNAVFRIDYGKSIINEAGNGIVFGIGQYF